MLFEKQQYQEDCVNNIIQAVNSAGEIAETSALLENLRNLPQGSYPIKKERRLDVLMETGTGKTFTYLKTMYEMNKQFGQNKFVIFVPRLAIRAGIVQNIDDTSDYFFQEYGKRIKKHIYGDKNGLSQVKDYVRNEKEFSVLILTSASIASTKAESRILTSVHEDLYGKASWLDAIGEFNPVVFIDEPHLLTGHGFTNAYCKHFGKSLLLRFGATFPEADENRLSNVIYTLNSITAFQDYLVKQISVTTAVDGESSIKFYPTGDRNKTVRVKYFVDDIEYEKKVEIDKKQKISVITGDKEHDFEITDIIGDEVFLSNRTKRKLSSDEYVLTDETIHLMIQKTIELHFEKEEKLFLQGIKTLSLFFIPNIADFRGDNPRIKNMFEEEYKIQRDEKLKKELDPNYRAYLEKDFDEDRKLCVAEGYFSGDRGSKEEKENYGVDLILHDKKNLLSTETPLRFVFSVWALQEGWDNPNIFTLCKLASTDRETKRRQQVGRGLRIAVNQVGKRQTFETCGENEEAFYKTNTLDVVVSGHEQNFIENIQREIIGDSITSNTLTRDALMKVLGNDDSKAGRLIIWLEDAGIIEGGEDGIYNILSPIGDFLENNRSDAHEKLKPHLDTLINEFKKATHFSIKNRNKEAEKIGIRAGKFSEFESLWEKITHKAKIIYNPINEEELLESIKVAFDKETIDPIRLRIEKSTYNAQKNEIETEKPEELGNRLFFTKKGSYEKFITEFSKRNDLPLAFCINLFNRLDKDKIKNNPDKARDVLIGITKKEIHRSIIQNVGYDFDGSINIDTNSIFYESDGKSKKEIEATKIGKYIKRDAPPPSSHYLYDKIVYDSGIELEVIQNDGETPAGSCKVTVFAKLPKISIPTPFKSYNPDFAYFIENEAGRKLFLIVETKGYDRVGDIPQNEAMKIDYAKKFFKTLNDEIPNVEIVYKERINKQDLAGLLNSIGEYKC